MRFVQKLGSNMASNKELFPEIPTKRARLQDVFSSSGHCSSNISNVNLSNGHGDEAPIDCITPSIQSENCENIHFPENLGGQGHSSLAEIALGSSTENEAEDIQSPTDEEITKNDEDESNDSWSTISDISGLSEDAWKPVSGPISWVQRQVSMGTDPRAILTEMLPNGMDLPNDLDNYSMWRLIINLLMEPPKRKKLGNINTLEDVVHLLKTCKKIVVLTGAGVSVSCGIPDFRSRDGIYARLAVDFPNLPDPQAMFDIHFFKSDPRPFFKFAKEIYPGQFEASKCHKFIKLLDDHGKLLQNYTQNIDTLEQVAGIKSVIQCHGSFATAQCMACKHKVDAEVIREDIFNQVIPICPVCPPDTPFAVMKPNIVFFGESLPEEFHRQMAADKDECDLLIVIGSSLKVRPVALIPNSLPANVPQILINRERLCHIGFDVELLGDCDVIVNELCKRLGEGWEDLCNDQPSLHQLNKSELSGDSRGHCANIANSYSNSCELRADTCLATSDSNSSDVTLQINNTDSKDDSCGTHAIVNDDISNKCLENNSESSSEQFHDANDSVEETTIRHRIESTDESTSFFQPPPRQSLAKRLKNDQFLFVKPNRYVFTGAEVYSDDSDDDSDDDSVDEKSESDQNDNSVNEKDNSMDSDNKDEKIVTTINNDNMKENYEISVRHIPVIDIAANSVS